MSAELNWIVNADRTVRFGKTIRRFREALGRRCRFRVKARRYYGTVWIADCYTDYVNPALFRKYEGPLMEGTALRAMGKGLVKEQVVAGALAEAIERISSFQLLAEGREVPLYELTSSAELVPASIPPEDVAPISDSTKGLSSGNTVNECVFHGLLEMYEHLDVERFIDRPGLGHRAFVDPTLTGFSPLVSGKMLAVAVPGAHSRVTTVHAVVCPKDLGPFVRTCAHLDGQIALQRAFNETVQSHKTRHLEGLQTFAAEPDIREVENHLSDDLTEDIRLILSEIREPVYVQDWTDPVMQIPVYRPFVMRMVEPEDTERTGAYVQAIMDDAAQYIDWE